MITIISMMKDDKRMSERLLVSLVRNGSCVTLYIVNFKEE